MRIRGGIVPLCPSPTSPLVYTNHQVKIRRRPIAPLACEEGPELSMELTDQELGTYVGIRLCEAPVRIRRALLNTSVEVLVHQWKFVSLSYLSFHIYVMLSWLCV